MTEEHWTRLRPLLIDASVDLLDACGAPLSFSCERTGARDDHDGIGAVISFAGEHMLGNLAVTTDRALLTRIHPQQTGEIPEADLRDWIREIANQLLGRLKNKLLAHGVRFQLSVPICLVDKELSCLYGDPINRHLLSFELLGSDFYVYFTAHLSPGAEIPAVPLQEAGIAEGDLMLF